MEHIPSKEQTFLAFMTYWDLSPSFELFSLDKVTQVGDEEGRCDPIPVLSGTGPGLSLESSTAVCRAKAPFHHEKPRLPINKLHSLQRNSFSIEHQSSHSIATP